MLVETCFETNEDGVWSQRNTAFLNALLKDMRSAALSPPALEAFQSPANLHPKLLSSARTKPASAVFQPFPSRRLPSWDVPQGTGFV